VLFSGCTSDGDSTAEQNSAPIEAETPHVRRTADAELQRKVRRCGFANRHAQEITELWAK